MQIQKESRFWASGNKDHNSLDWNLTGGKGKLVSKTDRPTCLNVVCLYFCTCERKQLKLFKKYTFTAFKVHSTKKCFRSKIWSNILNNNCEKLRLLNLVLSFQFRNWFWMASDTRYCIDAERKKRMPDDRCCMLIWPTNERKRAEQDKIKYKTKRFWNCRKIMILPVVV